MFDLIKMPATIGLGLIRKITDLWSASKSDSLIDYTQVARVEPIVLIDADCLYMEALPEVQQSLLSIFAGYYLQAVAISTNVGKVEVMRHLDKLNPRRNPADSAANSMGYLLAEESFQGRLPSYGGLALEASDDRMTVVAERKLELDIKKDKQARKQQGREFGAQLRNTEAQRKEAKEKMIFAEKQFEEAKRANKSQQEVAKAKTGLDNAKLEFDKADAATSNQLSKDKLQLDKDRRQDDLSRHEVTIDRDTISSLSELSNLSVGKMLNVEITDGLHRATIPIAIRLMASSLPSASLIHILTIGNKDNSAKERYHAWKSGRLEFIKDLCFCQDLIDEHRKNLMHDKDGVYSNLLHRQRGNQLSTIVSGNPTVATASNIVVMSKATADKMELELDGKLSEFKIRERIFKTTYVMIMAIIDQSWNIVTFYHRGINGSTELSVKDLKASNRGGGTDVSEILKAYQFGNSPSL